MVLTPLAKGTHFENHWLKQLRHKLPYGTKSPEEGGTRVSLTAQWYQVLCHVLTFCWPFPQDCEMAAIAPGNSYLHQHSKQEERGRWKKAFLLSAGHIASLTKACKPTSCKKRGWIWGRRRSLVWELSCTEWRSE